MKIKLLKSKVINGSVEPVGREVDVADHVAQKWIAAQEAVATLPASHPLPLERGAEKKSKAAASLKD